MTKPSESFPRQPKALRGLRVLSLALNLPGPAAMAQLARMGARCTKLEGPSGDPMAQYNPQAYQAMHVGVKTITLDLKTADGQKKLATLLKRHDVLLTSFRPSALKKLGLGQLHLRKHHPHLSTIAIVGQSGAAAEIPGHDLTYMAENGLIQGLETPASLYADMGGSLLVVQAVLQAALMRQQAQHLAYREVALADAAAYLALPRTWGLTGPRGVVGGALASYRVYACRDGRVAVAALEPHFALRLCRAAGLQDRAVQRLEAAATHRHLAQFFASESRSALNALALAHDLPLHTLPR